jgi:hypothetical protein
MKKYLLILFLFLSVNSFAQNRSNTDIIGTPIIMGYLEIAQHDFPEKMRWVDASNACKNLGDGWRLPDQNELDFIFKNANKIENLSDNYYWSSFVYDYTISEDVWRQRIGDGQTYSARPDEQNNKHRVRAVRTDPKATAESVIQTLGNTIKFGFFEIAQSDFKYPMNWTNAVESCLRQGEGWRLPTKEDLNTIFYTIPRRFKWFPLNSFTYNYYWGTGEGGERDEIENNTSFKSMTASFKWRPANFTGGQYKTIGNSGQYNFEDSYSQNEHYVRPVRNITTGTHFNFTNKEALKIIGNPILFEKLEISQFEFSEKMDKYDATKAIKFLGKGWRLPTIEELKTFYKDRDKFCDFGNDIYLSSDELYADKTYQLGLDFSNGKNGALSGKKYFIRAVRTIK